MRHLDGSEGSAALPGKLLGIEIGGTKLQIVAGDGTGAITRQWRATVRPEAGGDGVRRQIREGLEQLRRDSGGTQAGAIGVGFGGPIDWRTGRVARSYQVGGWEGFDLAGWLTETTGGAAVTVENDANTGALGEATRGAGANFDPVFYVTLGSGVGGGLVAGGEIYHGAAPGEAEFGHLRLGRDDDGRATVESRCSGWAVDRRIRRLKEQGSTGALARAIGGTPGGEARHLAAALRDGDTEARQILEDLASNLAFALSHAVHLLHPQVIVLGGGLSLIGEPLRASIAERLPALVMQAFHPVPEVRVAGLGEDTVPVGALELARRLASVDKSTSR